MASSEEISLIFKIIDQNSEVLTRLEQKLKRLEGSGKSTGQALNVALGNLLSKGIEVGIQAVGKGIELMMNEIDRASTAMNEATKAGVGIAQALNMSFDEAKGFVKDFSAYVTENFQGVETEVKDIGNAISDSIGQAMLETTGKVDFKDLIQQTADLANRMRFLGLSAENANDLFSGTKSLDELEEQDAIAAVKLRGKIEDMMKQQGLTDQKWQDLSQAQRTALLTKVLRVQQVSDGLAEEQKSFAAASAKLQNMFSLKFDTQLANRNNLTVMDAITDVITSLSDLFGNIGEALGITKTDALTAIFDGAKTLASWIDGLAKVFEGADFSQGLQNINLASLMTGSYDIGNKIGQALGNALANIDWAQLFIGIGQATLALMSMLAGILNGLAMSTAETTIAAITEGFSTLSYGLSGMFMTLTTGISTGFQAFVSFVSSGWNAAVSAIGSVISSLISQLSASVGAAWQAFTSTVTGTWNNVISAVTSYVSGIIDGIQSAIQSAVDSFRSAWDSVSSAISSVTSAVSSVSSFIEGLASKAQSLLGMGGSSSSSGSNVSTASNVNAKPVSFKAVAGSSSANSYTYNNYNPNFNASLGITASQNAEITAQQLIYALDRQWSQYRLANS